MAGPFTQYRTDLAAALKTGLPREYQIFPAGTVDSVTRPTLVLERTRIEKLPEAPITHLLNTFALTLICPATFSEDALDEAVQNVIDALDAPDIFYAEAIRGAYNAQPSYQFTLTAPSNRKA